MNFGVYKTVSWSMCAEHERRLYGTQNELVD